MVTMLLPLLSVAYAGMVLYNVLVVDALPVNILYTWHPICANLFIVFATLGEHVIYGKAPLATITQLLDPCPRSSPCA